MPPLVSAALTIARAMRGLTIPEVAVMAGVTPDDVFDAENFLEDVHPAIVAIIAKTLGVDLRWVDKPF
ncbi:helix-turn-helix domain-containing protein [Alicyclobacillus macrosporangiidus]|uniref:helix-turn-helix domain-containing protein n=1 Tax=Alicyclobacillus macrosporangiidus TaxID=392015 RepID=UPI00049573A9|nr:helix-turn-helix transcriptional regulator [Alicyclobacillus macrosporangiidus]